MKVAIIVWGAYRQFETAVRFWDETYSQYDPDYFFSIWDESIEKCSLKDYNFNIQKKVTQEDIFNFYPNATVNIEKLSSTKLTGANRIYFLIDRAIDLILKSGKEYDVIIVKRADTFEWFDFNILDSLKDNTLYTYSGKKRDKDGNPIYDFGDIIYYGVTDSVVRFIKGLVDSKYFKEGIENHYSPDKFLWESNFNIEKFPGSYFWQIVRPISLHLFNSNLPLKEFIDTYRDKLGELDGDWADIKSLGKKNYYRN